MVYEPPQEGKTEEETNKYRFTLHSQFSFERWIYEINIYEERERAKRKEKRIKEGEPAFVLW